MYYFTHLSDWSRGRSMKFDWKDLPERKNCFTVRNATMRNLDTGKIIQYYSANTRITVVQKCVTETNTYYRTRYAVEQDLDWAFEASAFGLPNEAAPSVPSPKPNSLGNKPTLHSTPSSRTLSSAKKQTPVQKVVLPKDGERRQHWGWLKRIFRRKNG